MRGVLWLLFGAALLGFSLTFVIEASFESRATRIQLVRKSPEGSLGTVGEPVDVIDVPKEAMVEPGAPGRAALVDADRLTKHGPILKADSIRGFAWLARIGCLLAAVSVFLGLRLSDRLRVGRLVDLTED